MSSHERLPIGTEIAGHKIEAVLGQGGFGITYKVRDRSSSKPAALKEYFPIDDALRRNGTHVYSKSGSEKRFKIGREAFLGEARTLNRLPEQSELVRIKGAFEKHGTVYALMDFVDGEPLEKAARMVLKRWSHVPPDLVLGLMQSMLWALDTVHSVGVLHCDIKPANVMIRLDNQPVLIDFGASRNTRLNANAGSMFSRSYAALEQFPTTVTKYQPRYKDGPAIDIFGLSVMLYELVSQSLPPDAEERFRQYRDHNADPFLPVRDNLLRNRVPASYPDTLLDAIDAGCALFAQDRPASAAQMMAMMGLQHRSKDVDPIPEYIEPSDPSAPKQWLIPALLVALAVIALTVGVFAR